MGLKIVVLSPENVRDAAEALAFDMPRLVIGRSDGCDVRLPDPSVSHRHCSVRQRGAEYVLVDEGSANGTFVGKMRLVPQTPHPLKSGDLVRIGRVWLELSIDASPVTHSPAAAAKELALRLVTGGLAQQGEDGRPRVVVREGPDAGAELRLSDPNRRYVAGRAKDADLVLSDPNLGRRHVGFELRGDHVVVTDLGSTAGTQLDDAPVTSDSVWRPGQIVRIAGSELTLEHAAADALAELERAPDEKLRADESFDPPARPQAGDEPKTPAPPEAIPTESPLEPAGSIAIAETAAQPRSWGVPEALVVLVAMVILVASAAGLWLLLHH